MHMNKCLIQKLKEKEPKVKCESLLGWPTFIKDTKLNDGKCEQSGLL